jgi:hypothetical protein
MSKIQLKNIKIDELLLNKLYGFIDNGIYEDLDQIIDIALNKLLKAKGKN